VTSDDGRRECAWLSRRLYVIVPLAGEIALPYSEAYFMLPRVTVEQGGRGGLSTRTVRLRLDAVCPEAGR